MLKPTLIILTISLTLTACGSDSEEKNTNPIITTPTSLEGTWIKLCGLAEGQDPNNVDAYYDIVTVTFSGNTFASEFNDFDDMDCTTPRSISPTTTTSGTFSTGAEVTTISGPLATKIDLPTTEFNGAAINSTSYDIFHFSSGTLHMGKITATNDASSELTRPDDLDYIRFFTRQ